MTDMREAVARAINADLRVADAAIAAVLDTIETPSGGVIEAVRGAVDWGTTSDQNAKAIGFWFMGHNAMITYLRGASQDHAPPPPGGEG